MPKPAPGISIIIPTYREGPNLAILVQQLVQVCAEADLDPQIILVDDDSQDGTEEVVAELQKKYPVELIVRKGRRGLSSAVLDGFERASHDILVVMDADLQHPPKTLPKLVEPLRNDAHDFVMATRYAPGGGISQRWPWHRRLVSRVARLLARPLTPLSDPLSGFFALPREVWNNAKPLSPIGYKIGLELYVKGKCRRPAEEPFIFQVRHAGRSKLTLAQQGAYLRHLMKLYAFRFPRITTAALLATAALAFWVIWMRFG